MVETDDFEHAGTRLAPRIDVAFGVHFEPIGVGGEIHRAAGFDDVGSAAQEHAAALAGQLVERVPRDVLER